MDSRISRKSLGLFFIFYAIIKIVLLVVAKELILNGGNPALPYLIIFGLEIVFVVVYVR